MASRPLPPGRRGKPPGRPSATAVNLPEVRLLSAKTSTPVTPSAVTPSTTNALLSTPAPTVENVQQQPLPVAEVVLVETIPAATAPNQLDLSPSPIPSLSVKETIAIHEERSLDSKQIREKYDESHLPAVDTFATIKVQSPSSIAASSVLTEPTPTIPEPAQSVYLVAPSLHDPAPLRAVIESVATSVQEVALPPVENTTSAAPTTEKAVYLGEYHPFQLLLPVDAVPEVPETIDCIYDDAAVEMQKNVMKAVKKVLNKNRTKLEDFKINSRLFGNNFMEASDYLDELVKTFGGIRALQLVPCLVLIQPDYMKRSSLLLAARTYRFRNLVSLEAQCQALQTPVVKETPPAVAHAVNAPAQPQVEEPKEIVEHIPEHIPEHSQSVVAEQIGLVTSSAATPDVDVTPSILEECVESTHLPSPQPQLVETSDTDVNADGFNKSILVDTHQTETSNASLATSEASHIEEEKVVASADNSIISDEPHLVETSYGTDAALDSSHNDISSPASTTSSMDAQQEIAPEIAEPLPSLIKENVHQEFSAIKASVNEDSSSDKLSTSDAEEAQPISSSDSTDGEDNPQNLFGEVFHPGLANSSTNSSMNNEPTESHGHSENLFGERLSTSSNEGPENLFGEVIPQTTSAEKSSTTPEVSGWNISQTPSGAGPAAVATRPSTQMLFGFATAGADSDSDSDDSGFSSS